MFRPFLSKLLRRLAIAYGVSYVLWLVLYFDFLKASFEFFGPSAERGSLVVVLFGATAATIALAGAVGAATLRVGDLRFVRGVVTFGVLANVGSLMAIGFDSPLAWGSLGVALIGFGVAWLAPAGQVLWVAMFVGVVGFGYPLFDHALWAARVAGPPAATAQAETALTADERLPSVYIVLYDELALSLVNDRASFQSLPNFSRLAEAGIFYPRAYANADMTHLSIPSFFLGDLPESSLVNVYFLDEERRSLPRDLLRLGYQLKVFNDRFGMCEKLPCAPLDVDADSIAIVDREELIVFARDELLARLTFGLRPNRNVGDLLQGQPARVFNLEHDPARPQMVFIHSFDAHRDYLRDRDGSLHGRPGVSFDDVASEAEAARISDNYFEQILYADSLAGPLVDALLEIPPEERIVVFLADHGISWREEPYSRGGGTLISDSIDIPVVLIAPGIKPAIDPQLLPLIDIYPTVIDLINRAAPDVLAPPPGEVAGLSIFASAAERAERPHRAFSAGCRYVLDGDHWRFEVEIAGQVTPKQVCVDAPTAAGALALSPAAEEAAIAASRPRPLPPPPGKGASTIAAEAALPIEEYLGWEIVRLGDSYHGVPLDGGLFALDRFQAGEYTNTISGGSREAVRREIEEIAEAAEANRPLVGDELTAAGGEVVEQAYHYAIIRYEGRYYVVPGTAGFVRAMAQDGSYTSDETLAEARAHVVPVLTALADRAPEVAALIEEGYKGFNVVRYDNRYYAIRQASGAFEIGRFRAGDYPDGVEDESFENIRRAIDEIVGG